MAGFRTGSANDGLQCLHVLERTVDDSFNLILLDIEMPVMNGFETAAEIRQREATGYFPGRIPIIAITGNARREYIDKGSFSDGIINLQLRLSELIDSL